MLLVLLFTLNGCSFPKIIILHDPLSAEEHNNLGRIYESQGKFDLAAQQYRAALKQDPKSLPSLLLLGDLSFKTKHYPEAKASYEKALELQPENGDIYNNLCWVYLEQNTELPKAMELIEKAMIAMPGHRAYYLDTKGMILLRMGKTRPCCPGTIRRICWKHIPISQRHTGQSVMKQTRARRSRQLMPIEPGKNPLTLSRHAAS